MSGKIQVIHSLVQKDGKYIVLPNWVSGDTKYGNLAHPNPLANTGVGDTQQGYPHGTKFVCGPRTFYYAKVGTVDASGKANIGLYNISESVTGATANITWGSVGSVPGDTVVGLVTTGFADTDPAEDAFAGGWLIPPYPDPYGTFEVLHSTTNTGARVSGEVDLTLDYGLVNTVPADRNYGELNFSQYINLGRGWAGDYGNWATVVGITLIDSIANTWQWVQTWGPCYVLVDAAMGDGPHKQMACFGDGGAVYLHDTYGDHQHAGYLLPSTSLDSGGVTYTASTLFFLQINP